MFVLNWTLEIKKSLATLCVPEQTGNSEYRKNAFSLEKNPKLTGYLRMMDTEKCLSLPYPTFSESRNTAAEPLRDFFTPVKAYTSVPLVSAFHWQTGWWKRARDSRLCLLQLKQFLLLQSFWNSHDHTESGFQQMKSQ